VSGRPEPKVLLMTLSQRTSGKGNTYLSGWLGKARLVGFRGEDDERGNPVWQIYAAEPAPREDQAAGDRAVGAGSRFIGGNSAPASPPAREGGRP
jgi:hypothetical protein